MSDQIYPHIDKYIRGWGTDYEPGLKIPGLSILEVDNIYAKKIEYSASVNSNSVLGEPPYEKFDQTIRAVLDFYGSKSFSWIIKSNEKYSYLEKALRKIGMYPEKTFFGMYFPLEDHGFDNMSVSKFSVKDAKSKEQIGDVVDLTCEIFGIDVNEREDMIQERLAILDNPANRSGFTVTYIGNKPAGYSRYRISSDGTAMYLSGSGVLEEFRGKHVYLSLLKHRSEIAIKNGCKLLTVFAREDTSKPILEKLGFRIEGKYLFMVSKKQIPDL